MLPLSLFPMLLSSSRCCSAPSRCCFAPSWCSCIVLAQRQALPRCRRIVARPAASFSAQTAASLHLSRGAPASCFRWQPVPVAPPRHPGQQHLPDGSPPLRTGQPLRRSAPACNKPHPAEKSTPVWLAIWRTWAGFANSQLLSAAFLSLYLYICAYPRYCHLGAAAQTDANLSAHLHRLPTPPQYLRQMRL